MTQMQKQPIKVRLHNAIYVRHLVDRKYLNWWWMRLVWGYDFLPLYMDMPFSRYQLAAWNCGTDWKDFRITIKESESGLWMFTIKQGVTMRIKNVARFILGHLVLPCTCYSNKKK